MARLPQTASRRADQAKRRKLEEYHRRRDFADTPEPAGLGREKPYPFEEPIFVVQKHRSRALHYDFRIEVDGVLASWAVPKGPSPDPRQKRLAVRTEDHPLLYASFEGVIPQGQYGAGTVMVWDIGFYRLLGRGRQAVEHGTAGEQEAVARGLEEGHVSIWLEGHKLRGGYSLTRMRDGRREQWLLVKIRDGEARTGGDPVRTEPDSILTGRSLREVAGGSPP